MFSFSISPPLADVLDISQVASNFGGSFMGVVQYNMDNTAFEVALQQFASLQPRVPSPELRQCARVTLYFPIRVAYQCKRLVCVCASACVNIEA